MRKETDEGPTRSRSLLASGRSRATYLAEGLWLVAALIWCILQAFTDGPNRLVGPLFLSTSTNPVIIILALAVGVLIGLAWVTAVGMPLVAAYELARVGLSKLLGSRVYGTRCLWLILLSGVAIFCFIRWLELH